jgi:large subunit ribosomal protein L4
MDEPRTRELLGYLDALEAQGRVLVIAPQRDERLELSARNVPSITVILADSLNTVDVLNADIVLITQPALAAMEEVYS